MLKGLLIGLSAFCAVLYPVLIYLGLSLGYINYLLPILAAVFIIRIFTAKSRSKALFSISIFIAVLVVLLCILSALLKNYSLMLYYPAAVNLIFLTVFSLSLLRGKAVITALAEIRHADLPSYAVAYTRKVTFAWCIFFILNALCAAYTACCGSIELWTLYNGLISYLLMGLFFAVEFLFRLSLQRKYEQNK